MDVQKRLSWRHDFLNVFGVFNSAKPLVTVDASWKELTLKVGGASFLRASRTVDENGSDL